MMISPRRLMGPLADGWRTGRTILALAAILAACTPVASPAATTAPSPSPAATSTPVPPTDVPPSTAPSVFAGPGRIVFTELVGSGHRFGIFTMKPDGTDRKAVTTGRNAVPRWSPDGRFLSVTTSDSAFLVSVMNADGSGVRNLPRPDPTLSLVCAAWSPDDTLLACEGWDTTKPGREGVYTVRTSDGGGLKRITTSTGGIHDIPGDFSPDGTQIAFVRATYAPAAIGQLWMASLDGSKTRKIADTLTSYGVSWSKDGHWIAGSANGRLLIFDLQDLGSPPRQISIAKGSAVGARWSPNGNALVLGFVRTGTATREIYTVNADGTNPVPLSDPLHLDEYPDWGPSP